jgi:hypothetical protein
MTGGHNNQPKEANAAYDNSITKITTGGQIGAPNEGGCCTEPPQKAKCIINPNTLKGTCNGGINSPLNNPDLDPEFFCQTDSECPATNGSGSICPWGDWEHNHHYGPDDSFLASSTQGISGGMFAFHSGTAASPKESFIKNVQCDDPGWCVQARPAPDKQIFWEGTGVFHNMKVKNEYKALPNFNACGINQPVTWSQGNRNKNAPAATIHYYKAHVGDFGEPAGQRQKPIDSCSLKEAPMGDWSMSCTEGLSGVELIDAETNAVKTALHPLCLAQDCSECPDWYDIEIHCGATAASPVAYTFKHFILQGNFQLHPAVTESCNYRCNGACEPGVLPDLHEECNDVSCDMYCAGFGGCCDCCDPCLD